MNTSLLVMLSVTSDCTILKLQQNSNSLSHQQSDKCETGRKKKKVLSEGGVGVGVHPVWLCERGSNKWWFVLEFCIKYTKLQPSVPCEFIIQIHVIAWGHQHYLILADKHYMVWQKHHQSGCSLSGATSLHMLVSKRNLSHPRTFSSAVKSLLKE